ncbi:MAG TPA: Rdx family protein [Gaiellales bacterium]|nr:Rdx family protein [Gaiellales bacterium]
MAAKIIGGWGPLLTVLELVPGTGGIFDVHVDGELLFTKPMIGRYPDPEDVLPLLRERIGNEVLGEEG